MTILKIVYVLLEDKLSRGYSDYIDIRFTREQAKEFFYTIHRIITYNNNMKEGTNNDCWDQITDTGSGKGYFDFYPGKLPFQKEWFVLPGTV